MKRIALLSAGAVALLACSDAPSAPMRPNLELISGGVTTFGDASDRATVFATFTVTVGGSSPIRESGAGINPDGKEMGSCGPGGRWTNPAGKQAGAIPHTHCRNGAPEVYSLEDITVRQYYDLQPSGPQAGQVRKVLLEFSEDRARRVEYNAQSSNTRGHDVIEVYALKNGARAGKFVIDLEQYFSNTANLVEGRCYIGEANPVPDDSPADPDWVDCLDKPVNADFFKDDSADAATATPDASVNGYLLWRKP